MTKRIFGLFLALCLVVGLLPMIALAEEAETPAITSTLAIATGNNDAPAEWKPELSAGMTAAYAKTTAEGLVTTDGASESDYNLKVEWAADGKPTLTLKNATLNNNNEYPNKKNTIQIDGTEDFVIVLVGTNAINGRLNSTVLNLSAYRAPFGIAAYNTGALTIKGTNKATDALNIALWCGNAIDCRYNALTIENATIDIKTYGTTNGYPQKGILMQYYADGCEDKTNLTVRNANLSIDLTAGGGNPYASLAIVMGKNDDKQDSANTGDILFQNSTVYINRSNSSGQTNPIVATGANNTITFDRCDVTRCYSWRVVFNYVPKVINCENVSYTSNANGATAYADALAGTKDPLRALAMTHVCGTAVADDKDCTTGTACDMCGKVLTEAKAAHTPAADDGDCTTAVMCANAGCEKIAIEAKAAHTPAADDNDCTTDTKCTVCGKVTTPAPGHTPAARPSCDVAANCTVCGKEALKAGEHTGGTATCQAKAKCTACGAEYGELAKCAGGTATCTKKAVCATCNKEYGELAAHTGGTATCLAKAKCTACGAEYGELAAHKGGTATCKDKAVCTVCNKAYGELSKTHTPAAEDGDCTTAIKCTVCGAETTAAAKEHKFTNDKDTSCDNTGCKHTRTISANPNTGDISILLTAAVALTSAVGFAGVTVLRKKEN